MKFLLKAACVSPRHYCMLKQRAGFIIATYEGSKVDWGYITGVALTEQLRGVQQKKPMKPIFAWWLTVLCPTRATEPRRKTHEKRRDSLRDQG